jgi:hypothetical protein
MGPTVQTMIEQANKRNASANKRVFAKKSSDTQLLDHLTKTCRVALDRWGKNAIFVMDRDFKEAMRELLGVVALAEKRFK